MGVRGWTTKQHVQGEMTLAGEARLPRVGVNDPPGVGVGHVCQSQPELTVVCKPCVIVIIRIGINYNGLVGQEVHPHSGVGGKCFNPCVDAVHVTLFGLETRVGSAASVQVADPTLRLHALHANPQH